jgi:hypothetical protein
MGSWQLPETTPPLRGGRRKALSAWRWETHHEEGDFIMDKTKDAKAKKEKKEKKFNSDRSARQVKAALKEAFPKENFIVNTLVDRVEVLYENTACTVTELNTFNAIFCNLGNIKKEQLQFAKIKKEPAAAPAASK